jgi:hypothetical protein
MTMLDDLQDKMTTDPAAFQPEEVTALRRLLARLSAPPMRVPRPNGATPFDVRIAATQLEVDDAMAEYDSAHNRHFDALMRMRTAVGRGKKTDRIEDEIRELREQKDRAHMVLCRARSRRQALEDAARRFRLERW